MAVPKGAHRSLAALQLPRPVPAERRERAPLSAHPIGRMKRAVRLVASAVMAMSSAAVARCTPIGPCSNVGLELTSGGKRDARGRDEATWAADRRVDLLESQ